MSLLLTALFTICCASKTAKLKPPPALGDEGRIPLELKILPSGDDLIVWGDMARIRRWPPARNIMQKNEKTLQKLVARFREVHGLDPWRDLDVILISAPLSGSERSMNLLLKGKGIKPSLMESMGRIMEEMGTLKRTRYRETALMEVGRMCIGFPDENTAASSTGVWVRRLVDLMQGFPEESVTENEDMMYIWRMLLSETMGNRAPALAAVAVVPHELSNRFSKELGTEVRFDSFGVRVSLGRWLGVAAVFRAPDKEHAEKLVAGLGRWAGTFFKSGWIVKSGMEELVRLLHVHSEGKYVYVQFSLPGELFEKIVKLIIAEK